MFPASSKIQFAPADEVVLYSAASAGDDGDEVEDRLGDLPSLEELQDCVRALAYRDPLGQVNAVKVLASAPHVFEDSPLAGDIFADFDEIFKESPSTGAISAVCSALRTCAVCFSPGTTIRYIVSMAEAIQSRVEQAHAQDSFTDAACAAVVLLVECVEDMLVVLSKYVDYVGPFFSDFYRLGAAVASLFDSFVRVYNFYQLEIAQAYPGGQAGQAGQVSQAAQGGTLKGATGGVSATLGASAVPADPPNHITLLNDIADQISHWARCAAAIPFACEAVWEHYSAPAVVERLIGAVSPGMANKCASALLDVLLSPALVDVLREGGFLQRVLALDPAGACKHVLQSVYLAELVLAEILGQLRGSFGPLAGAGGRGPQRGGAAKAAGAPGAGTAGGAGTAPGASSAPAPSSPRPELLDLFVACLAVLDSELLPPVLLSLHPNSVAALLQHVVRHSTSASPSREFIFAGGRKTEVLENDESHAMNPSLRPSSPEERALEQGVPPEYLQPETAPIRVLIYDLFLSRLEEIGDFPYASTVVPALLSAPENAHGRHGVPHTLARILSAPCFARLLSRKAQSTCFRLLAGTSVAMMSSGLLQVSSPCLRGALNLAILANARRQTLEMPNQVAASLRALLAAKSQAGSLSPGDALALMLLPSYFLFGADREVFISADGYGESALKLLDSYPGEGSGAGPEAGSDAGSGAGAGPGGDSALFPLALPASPPPLAIPGSSITLPPLLEACLPWPCIRLEYALNRLRDPGRGLVRILKAVRPGQGAWAQ